MNPVTGKLALYVAACLLAPVAIAQTYPSKPIRIIVGFAAGTTTDTVARLTAEPMQKILGQPVIVEARTGAAGGIAGGVVAKADPDGYTLYFGLAATLHPVFTKNNPIDASKEFTPISDSMTAPYALFTSSKLPVTNYKELVAYAKSNPPGKLNLGKSVAQQELIMEVIKSVSGITFTTIPFASSVQAIPLLQSGEVALFVNVFANHLSHIPHIVRPMFVTAAKRSPQFPDVPTSAEVGIPGMEASAITQGYWAPSNTPKAIADKVSAAAIAAVKVPEVVAFFRKVGFEPVGSTAEEQLRNYEAGMKFWTYAARLGNYQPQ
jgi:tripartite-type tricarboxylate transporter receptor subunit TctC